MTAKERLSYLALTQVDICIVTSIGFEAKLLQMGMVLFPSSACTIAMYSCSQILKRDKKLSQLKLVYFSTQKLEYIFSPARREIVTHLHRQEERSPAVGEASDLKPSD